TEAQLLEMTARVASLPLDRSKPLLEFWLVERVEPAEGSDVERFAMIFKTHHALVDGISGVDLATVLLDFTSETPAPDTEGLEGGHPRAEPNSIDLLVAGARGAAGTVVDLTTRVLSAATEPTRSLHT